jgi:hypothetical protein
MHADNVRHPFSATAFPEDVFTKAWINPPSSPVLVLRDRVRPMAPPRASICDHFRHSNCSSRAYLYHCIFRRLTLSVPIVIYNIPGFFFTASGAVSWLGHASLEGNLVLTCPWHRIFATNFSRCRIIPLPLLNPHFRRLPLAPSLYGVHYFNWSNESEAKDFIDQLQKPNLLAFPDANYDWDPLPNDLEGQTLHLLRSVPSTSGHGVDLQKHSWFKNPKTRSEAEQDIEWDAKSFCIAF